MANEIDLFVHAKVRRISNGFIVTDELAGGESYVQYDFYLQRQLEDVANQAIRQLVEQLTPPAPAASAEVIALPTLPQREER